MYSQKLLYLFPTRKWGLSFYVINFVEYLPIYDPTLMSENYFLFKIILQYTPVLVVSFGLTQKESTMRWNAKANISGLALKKLHPLIS